MTKKVYDARADISLDDWLAALPRPLVFTNGCFDILHRGHAHYLQQAADLGAALLVGVNSDGSTHRQQKKPNPPARPINPLSDRMALLAALTSVDAVIAFDEDTPRDLILRARPEHLVKGGDWQPQDIVGGADVVGWGGQVHSIPFEFTRSTSALIKKIRGD